MEAGCIVFLSLPLKIEPGCLLSILSGSHYCLCSSVVITVTAGQWASPIISVTPWLRSFLLKLWLGD